MSYIVLVADCGLYRAYTKMGGHPSRFGIDSIQLLDSMIEIYIQVYLCALNLVLHVQPCTQL